MNNQSMVPLDIAILLWSLNILGTAVWIKLLMLFKNFEILRAKKTKKRVKEKVLHKESSYPFDDGEPINWFNL